MLLGIVIGVVLVFLIAMLSEAHAAVPYPITITTCKGYTVSRKGDGTLVVRCPGRPIDQPMFSIAAGCCPRPVLIKRELLLTIDCRQ